MEIKRDFYLDKLIRRKGNGLVKVITGVRGCGKSYLLNTLFFRHLLNDGVPESNIIRFAFDSADDLSMLDEDFLAIYSGKRKADPHKLMEFIKGKVKGDGMHYLLLDEVQLLGSFEAVLNSFAQKDNMDVFVTGSNAKFLSKDVITEFAGRGDEIRMHPLSFSEFMTVFEGDKYEGLSEYMLYGGIPLVVLCKDKNDKASTLENLLKKIYMNDISERNKVRNRDELGELLNIAASSVGSLTNPEKLKNAFHSKKNSKMTAATIKKYLDYFEDSFLIESALRYDVKGKAYIETPRKYYFGDLGLRNARLGFRQSEVTHVMENIVYNELRVRGYRVDVGIVPISEKGRDGKLVRKQLEVDFVCNLGSKRYYIQSAYSIPDEDKRNQETKPFSRIDDYFKRIIITRDMVPTHYDEKGILTMNIYDFLLNPNSLEQ